MPAPALLSDPAIVSATGMLADIMGRRPQRDGYSLRAVAADRFDRAAFHGFLAERFFLGTLRLFVNEGVAAVVVAFVIRRRGFAAKIAVDALIVDVVRTGNVLGIFVGSVSHILPLKANWNVERNPSGANRNLPPGPHRRGQLFSRQRSVRDGAQIADQKGENKYVARVPGRAGDLRRFRDRLFLSRPALPVRMAPAPASQSR